jgi:hypothetical protein
MVAPFHKSSAIFFTGTWSLLLIIATPTEELKETQ